VYIRPKTMPRTVKILKNRHCIFDKGGNLLRNGIQHFAIRMSQLPAIAF